MGVYGYERDTSPNLDDLARSARVYERAFSTASKTTPAVASLLTGLYPYRHGVRALGQELAGENETLAEKLSRLGYRSAAFVSSTVMIDRLSNLGQGFHHYDDALTARESNRLNFERTAEDTVIRVSAWLEKAPSRFFLFVHLVDPHGPYTAPDAYREQFVSETARILPSEKIPRFQRLDSAVSFEDYVDAYDREVAYADWGLGVILDGLKDRGLFDEALVIVTADHGESHGEQGVYFRHSPTLDEAVTRVPLIVKPPAPLRQAPGRSTATASLVDIVPTVLDYVGANDGGDAYDGISLRRPEKIGSKRFVFSERRNPADQWVRGAHSKEGTTLQRRCTEAPERFCPEWRPVRTETGQSGVSSEQALAAFVEASTKYQLAFDVFERYRPHDRKTNRRGFLDRVSEALAEDEVEGLSSLGYLN